MSSNSSILLESHNGNCHIKNQMRPSWQFVIITMPRSGSFHNTATGLSCFRRGQLVHLFELSQWERNVPTPKLITRPDGHNHTHTQKSGCFLIILDEPIMCECGLIKSQRRGGAPQIMSHFFTFLFFCWGWTKVANKANQPGFGRPADRHHKNEFIHFSLLIKIVEPRFLAQGVFSPLHSSGIVRYALSSPWDITFTSRGTPRKWCQVIISLAYPAPSLAW